MIVANGVAWRVPTCPPAATKTRPARYADRAIMPVLNARWATEGPRRNPNMVQAPTSPAPPARGDEAPARQVRGQGHHAGVERPLGHRGAAPQSEHGAGADQPRAD